MAKIIPFNGIHYNKEKVPDLGLVLTPPYDVISQQEQERLHQLNEYNFIHIILGREEPGDDKENNRYTRAANYLDCWLEEGILREDETPSIYLYSQEFHYNGRRLERTGFLALLRLEEFEAGIVHPHERTLSKPKQDRLRLLRASQANTEPIFVLYEDHQDTIKDGLLRAKRGDPFLDVEYGNESRHRIWAISDNLLIARIQQEMEEKSIYIADGHHRYETSLCFRNEHRDRMNESYNYIMVYMVDLDDSGLMILPAHRLIRNLVTDEIEGIRERIRRYFAIEKVCSIERLRETLKDHEEHHAFGLYDGGIFTLLLLKLDSSLDEISDDNPHTRKLNVTILHNLILGMATKTKEAEEKINYTTSEAEAKELVDKGEYQMAFFLNPTKIEEVKDVALSGGVMPGKATYFYPKPLSGLMLNKF